MFGAEDLESLLARFEDVPGVRLSLPQRLAAHRVVKRLAQLESLANRADYAPYIAPTVCTSPDEQTAFYECFKDWLEHQTPAVVPDEHDARPDVLPAPLRR